MSSPPPPPPPPPAITFNIINGVPQISDIVDGVRPQTLGIALGIAPILLPTLVIGGAGLNVWGNVQKRRKEIKRKESVRVAAEFARANPPPLNLANFEAFISDLPVGAKTAVSLKGSMADGDNYFLCG